MKEYFDHIVFHRDLPPEREAELRRLIATDPEALELLRAWTQIRSYMARRLEEAVPDTDLFVSFVLLEHGRGQVLSPKERARVEQAAPALREAISRHPGLRGTAEDILAAAEVFDRHWNTWFGGHRGVDGSLTSGERRPDRAGRAARSATFRWSARAAVLGAFVVFAALIVFVLQRDHAMTSVTTAENEIRVIELGDGSSVRLLGSSQLSFTPPDDAAVLGRQALLEGRAFFDVAPASDGLIVKTETAQLTVLGTSFGVEAGEDRTEVVLAHGRLTLASRRDPRQIVTLSSGQMSRVAADERPTTPVEVAVHERLSWTGLFVFASTPLGEIGEVLGEHYQTEIDVPASLESERVTGRFEHSENLEDILQVISAAVGAQVQRTTSGGYRLDGARFRH